MQHTRGFIDGCANQVTLISWEAEHTKQQTGQAFYRQKTIPPACYLRVTEWLVTRLQSNPVGADFAGYIFTKQSYWHKLLGLWFKLKSNSISTNWRGLFTGGGESHHFTGNQNPSPGCLPAPAPAAPHNKTYFSASKTNKKNIRHMNYRHR